MLGLLRPMDQKVYHFNFVPKHECLFKQKEDKPSQRQKQTKNTFLFYESSHFGRIETKAL